MKKSLKKNSLAAPESALSGYGSVLAEVVEFIEQARRASARTVNSFMTATYWEIGRRIFEFEQKGKDRADYGERLIEQLSFDLRKRFGRGFGVVNLNQMRKFYLEWPNPPILQTASEELSERLILPGPIAFRQFSLPWSHYVRLLAVKNTDARAFYEKETLRGGWSVRQLDRQIHADAGQMHMYLNYAREHWTLQDENPPVGLILCAEKDSAVVRYALEGLPNKVLAAEYLTALPDEKLLAEELNRTRKQLELRS